MRTRTFLFVLLLLPAALLLGLLVAPSMKEMALMELSSSNSEQSLETYAKLHSKGDTSVNVLAPLINLHLHYGNDEQAIALLEDFMRENPQNVEARKRLAALYKVAQRLRAYCAALEEIETRAPSSEELRKLADAYAFLGDYKNENHALRRLAAVDGEKLTEDDAVKMAKFSYLNRDIKASIDALERLWDKKNGAVSFDALYFLTQLRLKSGNAEKAFSTAARFIEKSPREEDALTLSELFQMHGQNALARDILKPFMAAADSSPSLKVQLVSLLFAEGEFATIERLLRNDFSNGRLADKLAETLIDLALRRKDYALAEAVLRSANFDDLSTIALERYADFAFKEKQKPLADVIRARLEADRQGKNEPLLSALLGLAEGDTSDALAALLAVPTDELTHTEERLMAAHALFFFGKVKPAQSLIYDLPTADVFGFFSPAEFAALHLDNKQTSLAAEKRLVDAAYSLPSEIRSKAEEARFFLKIGLGDYSGVEAWLGEHPALDSVFYEEAFDMASRHQQGKIALAVAKQHDRTRPSPASRAQLVDALLSEKQYREALTLMETDADKPAQKELYIGALSQWARMIKSSDKNFSVMQPFIHFALRHVGQNEKEQREMVYLLEEAGFKPEAEGLLVNLAAGRPYQSKEAQELLGFWGDRLSPAALAWIKSRAVAASGAEQAQWLSHLNACGQSQAVIDIAQGWSFAPALLMDVYMEALVASRDAHLADILAQEVERETDAARLKRLATLGEQAGIQDAKDKGWLKVHALDPDDDDGLRYVSLREAGANHYEAALPLLRRALRKRPDDYQLNLAFAGILQHKKKKFEAKVFYNRAFDQLSNTPEKSFYDRVTLAHLLYRKEGLASVAALFRELIRENPDDKSLRADFAEILMENKRYDEAFAVLSP